MLEYDNKELMKDCQPEISWLLTEHWRELPWYQEHMPCAPRFDVYIALQSADIMTLYTARTEDGLLVGYATVMRDYHLHSKNTMAAHVDGFYLHESYRKGRNTYRFLDVILERERENGTDVLTMHVPVENSFGRVCQKLGMHPHDQVYAIDLGE